MNRNEIYPYTALTLRNNRQLTLTALDWCRENAGLIYMDWDAVYSTDNDNAIIWYFKYQSLATEFKLRFG